MRTAPIHRPSDAGTATCRHYWILESDAAAETTGTCRLCGATRVFQNHLPGDRYAKEWREARRYATVLDRRLAPVPQPHPSEESAFEH
ncbi:MAG: hypothetical protein RMM58_11400 [Chloroflexota bacterium]|nr:hypothetical protein [Dehalococcoidia bacterium]MDW8254469.1 hypothetical protein [Chloroflexota bacterium]